MGFFSPQSHSSTTLASTTPSSTTHRRHTHRTISGLTTLTLLTTLAGGAGVTAAYASTSITLADNAAVVLSVTGRLYQLNLTTAEITEGPTLSIYTGPSAAMEGAINSDSALSRLLVLELTPEVAFEPNVRSLSVEPGAGTTTIISGAYGPSVSFGAITRGNDGAYLVGYTNLGSPKIATFSAATGVLTAEQTVTLSSSARTLAALVTVGATLIAFTTNDITSVYTVNPATGELGVSGSLGSSILAGEGIVAADATSDGTVYLLTRTAEAVPVLYRVTSATSANPSVTRVGLLTVSGGGPTPEIQALAISTLLDSERPEPEPEPEPEPDNAPANNPGQNSSSPSSVALATPPASPVLASTGAAPLVATWLGVLLLLSGVGTLLGQRRRTPH